MDGQQTNQKCCDIDPRIVSRRVMPPEHQQSAKNRKGDRPGKL